MMSDTERLNLSKQLGLTPANNKEEKELYYNGIYADGKYIKCTLSGVVSEEPKVVQISFFDKFHNIHIDCLKEMQPTKKQLKEIGYVDGTV